MMSAIGVVIRVVLRVPVTSGLPPINRHAMACRHVSNVPNLEKTSIQSIISLAVAKSAGGTVRPMPSSLETCAQLKFRKFLGCKYFGDGFSLILG
jgi:hypothetical protein